MGKLRLKVKKMIPNHYVGHKKVKRNAILHEYRKKAASRQTVYKNLLICNGKVYEYKSEIEKDLILHFIRQNSFGIDISYDTVTLTFPWWKIGSRLENLLESVIDLESLSILESRNSRSGDKIL